MPAPKGNNYNMKWKTREDRQEACKAVCEHLKAGYSQKSFPLADWDTVASYMENFPEDFPPTKIQEAMRCNLHEWEKIGLFGAKGEIEGFNAASWIFNMKNRFREDWRDKQETDHSGLIRHEVTRRIVKAPE